MLELGMGLEVPPAGGEGRVVPLEVSGELRVAREGRAPDVVRPASLEDAEAPAARAEAAAGED